jgi:hypothetical protein
MNEQFVSAIIGAIIGALVPILYEEIKKWIHNRHNKLEIPPNPMESSLPIGEKIYKRFKSIRKRPMRYWVRVILVMAGVGCAVFFLQPLIIKGNVSLQSPRPIQQTGGTAMSSSSNLTTQTFPAAKPTIRSTPFMPSGSPIESTSQGPATFDLVEQTGGVINDIKIRGDLVYIGQGPRLIVLKVNTEGKLELIGKSAVLPSIVKGFDFTGDYVYIADSKGGLIILSVKDPSKPAAVGMLSDIQNIDGVIIKDKTVFIAASDRLCIYDINDPMKPKPAGCAKVSFEPCGFVLNDQYAFVSSPYGIEIFKINNISAPEKIGEYRTNVISTAASKTELTLVNDYLYVSDFWDGLYILDISNPQTPLKVSTPLQDVRNSVSVAEMNNYLYIADTHAGIRVIDASTPSFLVDMGTFDIPRAPVHVTVGESGRLYVGLDGGLCIESIADPQKPQLLDCYSTVGTVRAISLYDNYAYISSTAGLHILNISDPHILNEEKFLSAPYSDLGVFDHNKFYLEGQLGKPGSTNGFFVLDFSSPTDFLVTFSGLGKNLPSTFDQFTIIDQVLYLISGDTFKIIDVRDPANAKELAKITYPEERLETVFIKNNLAYLGGKFLRLLDISDPTSVKEIYKVNLNSGITQIIVSDKNAYCAGYNGLIVLDLKDSQKPRPIGFLKYFSIQHLALVGHVLVFTGMTEFNVIDISEPAKPQLIETISPPSYPWNITSKGDLLFVADGEGGILLYKLK